MRISYNTQTFTGYDATRPLQGLFVSDKRCADALKNFSNEMEVDVFTPSIVSKSIRKEQAEIASQNKFIWAQDYVTVVENRGILFDSTRDYLKRVLRSSADGLSKSLKIPAFKSEPHLRGGNFFICDVNGSKKLLVSDNKVDFYPQDLTKKLFGVEEICSIPSLDWHIDLFVRPLDNGNVLVADYKKTEEGLNAGLETLREHVTRDDITTEQKVQLEEIIDKLETEIGKWEITKQFAQYKPEARTSQVIEELSKNGFNPISVPGTHYYLDGIKHRDLEEEALNNFAQNMTQLKELAKGHTKDIQDKVNQYIMLKTLEVSQNENIGVKLENIYQNNFINAIVTKNKNGEIVYVTNAPLFDKALGITPEIEELTGFSTKKMFIDSVKPYIKEENIYFIDERLTEQLFKFMGGIHCTAAEIVKC